MRPRTALAALACDSALTRDEFVTQANAICAAGNAKIEAAVPENSSGPPSGVFAEVNETASSLGLGARAT